MDGFMLGIIAWFLISFIFLLNYGRSESIYQTTNVEHLAILLACLPATLMIVIVSLGIEIIDFIKDKWN